MSPCIDLGQSQNLVPIALLLRVIRIEYFLWVIAVVVIIFVNSLGLLIIIALSKNVAGRFVNKQNKSQLTLKKIKTFLNKYFGTSESCARLL